MYACAPKGNPNYTYRESIPLGVTAVSALQFRRFVVNLQDEWQGWSYDLLRHAPRLLQRGTATHHRLL